jgi:hypothetical protein
MQSSNIDLGATNPRDNIIRIYLSTIQESFISNHPAIKLINFGTGSGKTYQFFQSVFQTIRDHPGIQVIGLYVAPLREHLRVPTELINHNPDKPAYILYSQDWKTSDEFLKKYTRWIQSLRKNQKLWSGLSKAVGQDKTNEASMNLSKALSAISDYELLQRFSVSGSDTLKPKLLQAQYEITGSLEKFLETYIKSIPDESKWVDECLELVIIFYPLFLLREKSGILLMTYDKFETEIPYFAEVGGRWIKRSALFDQYVREHSSDTRRFLIAFDEQEDGYQIMLDHQIDIISPKDLAINNALSSIYREFALLFSPESKETHAFLKFVNKNPGALREWNDYFDKGKIVDRKLLELADMFQQLTRDEGNSSYFLTQIAAIDAGIETSFKTIADAFGSFGAGHSINLDFNKLSRVLSTFENNRSLLIPHKLYSKYAEELMNIFTYNNLYIYNIEVLKSLIMRRKNSGHVHIVEQEDGERDLVSVAELIYSILAVRLVIEEIQGLLSNVLDAEDSQSRSLDIWSRQIVRLRKAYQDKRIKDNPSPYLNRFYVYESLKSIINVMEISRYQNTKNNLIHSPLREVSIGSTAILTSPEHRILSMLESTRNVVFFISATGGVYGDLTTSFDFRYLEDELRDETGCSSFAPMRENELALSEKIRSYRRGKRAVSIGFFDEDFSSFPNLHTREVVDRFEKTILKGYLDERKTDGRWFGVYKVQELQNFIRYLFYLFEDDSIQEIISFTQTLTWIRQLIQHAARINHGNFIFQASDDHPNIYTVQVNHKSYHSPVRIKLILYESKFNSLYKDKSTTRTYLDELVESKNQKIFFISAYQSASKGLNPIIKMSTDDDQGKDFDALVLLMDKYFTAMGPGSGISRDSEKSTTLLHFTLMKNLVSRGDTTIEIKDFNRYLSDPEAAEFQEMQHKILLGKGILQAIGRTERRDFHGQTIKIYINEESRKNLVHYYRHLQQKEPYELRKLSVNNHEVYLRVVDDERNRTIQDYDNHIYTEIDATVIFQDYRKCMLDEIDRLHENVNAYKIIEQWEMLRDPLAFSDQAGYLTNLRNPGAFPSEFVDSLFYRRGLEQPAFVPYLTHEEEDGKSYLVVSDSIHGEKVYPYRTRLYPEFLKIGAKGYDADGEEIAGASDLSTGLIHKMYRKFIPNPAVFDEYIPRPHFFYDVLYPSLAENMVEAWIKEVIFDDKSWASIQSTFGIQPLVDFKTYHKLFERFDLFYTRGNALYCIDVKAWSETSGYRLSQKTIDKAQQKLEDIQSSYPEFTNVQGLLLNLHSPLDNFHKLSSSLTSGNLFYLDSNHQPIESNTLKEFLVQRGR